jgi:hypothetical protein
MPAVTVHGLAQAEAGLAAAGPRGVLLLSGRGAAGHAGPGWFLALVALAAERHPGVPHAAALDCADAGGAALAALRAGARILVLDRACPAFPAIAAAAAEAGALLLAERPPSLDLAGFDARRRRDVAALHAWLATEAPQAWPKPPSP